MNRREFLKLAVQSGFVLTCSGSGWASQSSAMSDVAFLTPADSEYPERAILFNARIVRTPKVIAVCFTEKGVQQAIALARERGLPVAIRSGGHSFEGFSLNDDGMVIDLSFMNSQRLLEGGQYVVEPACRLMEMYEYLLPQGRLLPSGSCGMVGIAGLTLGGGYGIFSREYGLTIDWVKRIRLVDAKGEVHEAGPGDDLFWACRGAGNGNFGVVTQMQFDTVAAPSHISRYFFKAANLTTKRVVEIAKHWFAFSAQLPKQAFSAFVLNGKSLNILVTDTQVSLTPGMNDLLRQLESVMDKRLPDTRKELLPGIRPYYGRLTPLNFKNASAGYYRGYGDIEAVAEKVFETVLGSRELLFQINTLGGAIGNSRLPEELGCYPHRAYPYLGEIQSYWEQPGRESDALVGVEKVQSMLATNGVNAHYSNYPDINFRDSQTKYYGAANLLRLQSIKRRYDPDNLFRHPQSIKA